MEDLLSLAEAAEELGLAPVSLRAAVGRGTFRARKFGNTWVTTRAEVERYRRESLGRVGRPGTIFDGEPGQTIFARDRGQRPGPRTIFDRDRPKR